MQKKKRNSIEQDETHERGAHERGAHERVALSSFRPLFYKFLCDEVSHLEQPIDLYNHYCEFGIKEGIRNDEKEYASFDSDFFCKNYKKDKDGESGQVTMSKRDAYLLYLKMIHSGLLVEEEYKSLVNEDRFNKSVKPNMSFYSFLYGSQPIQNKEPRFFSETLYRNFNIRAYHFLFPETSCLSFKDSYIHYIDSYPKYLKMATLSEIHPRFDEKIYQLCYPSIKNGFSHFIKYGIFEWRNIRLFENADMDFIRKCGEIRGIEDYLKRDFPQRNRIFLNKYEHETYAIFDFNQYIRTYMSQSTIVKKEDAFDEYNEHGKRKGNIFFTYPFQGGDFTPPSASAKMAVAVSASAKMAVAVSASAKMAVAVSIYSTSSTPPHRILCSKICLNSIVLAFRAYPIIFVIDHFITDEHLAFLLLLAKGRKNITIYQTTSNMGIAKTKNICIQLCERKGADFICLLDDDIEILQDIGPFIKHVFHCVPELPLMANYNTQLPYENEPPFFNKTDYFFGNILVFQKKYIPIYGYFGKFEYMWGEEHVEITHRYLARTPYARHAIRFDPYIQNEQILGEESTLHLHSMDLDDEGVAKNKNFSQELLNNPRYVDFHLNDSEIKKIN